MEASELPPPEGFRARTARGVLVLSSFRIGLAALNLLRNVALAAFLTREEYGLWGLILATLITLGFLKQIGITDKFVQQREPDQEAAFQKAFTLNLAYSGVFYLLVAAALPVYALAVYDRPEVLGPAFALSAALLISAFHAPTWVYYRRMEYRRQLTLESIDPVVTAAVMISLLAAGLDIWGLVIGSLAGSIAAAAAAVRYSPYRLRIRFDRSALREYVGFSWPLLYAGVGGLLVVQGALIVGNAALGLAAVGSIGLAGNFAGFANRVDMLLRRTLYPAVAAVRDRTEVMREAFEKSNRLGLMWALPFGLALTLFAPDLARFVLGERWQPAVPLLQIFGPIFALGTIGFAWVTFYQATGNTRPVIVSSTVTLVGFFAVVVPLMLTVGTLGYGYGMAAIAVAQLAVRGFFLRRLFPGFRIGPHSLRALVPLVPAAALVGLARLLESGERTAALAATEAGVYTAVIVAVTALRERALLGEAVGYLRAAIPPRRATG